MPVEPIGTQDLLMDYANWALDTGLWNGREIHPEGVNEFKDSVIENLVSKLFSQDEESYAFQKMAADLAFIGARDGDDEEIIAELAALQTFQNGVALPAGLCKSLKKFWKKHKVEVIVGIAVVAVIATVAIGALCAAGAAGAVGAIIPDESKKAKEPPKPRPKESSEKASIPMEWPETDLSLEKGSILFNGESLVLNDALQPKTLSKSIYSQYDDLCKWKQENPYFQPKESIAPLGPVQIRAPSIPYREIPVYSSKNLPPVTGKLAWVGQMIDWAQTDNDLEQTRPLPTIQNATSHLFRTPGEQRKDICILASNGIGTHLYESIHHAEYIGELAQGYSVQWLHNNSNIILVDALEYAALNAQGSCPNTKRLFQESCLEFHEVNKDNPTAKMLVILHSQACMQQKSAIEKFPFDVQQRLIVVTVGASAIIPKRICYQSFNYASELDIVNKFEVLCKSLHDLDSARQALEDYKELIILEPHIGAGNIDHDFESPTFVDVIRERIENYLCDFK